MWIVANESEKKGRVNREQSWMNGTQQKNKKQKNKMKTASATYSKGKLGNEEESESGKENCWKWWHTGKA